MTTIRTASSKKEEWPMMTVRKRMVVIKPDQVKEIVFGGLYRTRNLTKSDEIAPFLAGLQSATYPWDPKKGLPTGDTMDITVVLKDGQSIGPFGFSTERASHAFGPKFAKAWNDTFNDDKNIPKILVD